MILPVKELQVGDLVIFGPNAAFIEGCFAADMITEPVTGISINLVCGIVDLQTTTRAVYDIPMDLEIEILRS